MRAAFVNMETSVVDHVHMVAADHVADGFLIVASDTANRGDTYVDGAFVPPVAAIVMPAPAVLLARLRLRRDAVLATPRQFILAASPPAPAATVLCDGSDKTMVDLGIVWRRGIVDGDGTITWHGPDGRTIVIKGTQGVMLEGLVSAWRDEVRQVYGTVKASILGGGPVTVAALDAIVWPVG